MKRSEGVNAYPLAWPSGWPRTLPEKRERSRFDATVPSALAFLEDEVRRLGGKNLILSSNFTLGKAPEDPGVCAYFTYQEQAAAIPCDRWTKVEDNLHAIAKTIEALRGIERWGAKHMVKAAFTGFAALPSPGATLRPWRDVLELPASSLSGAHDAVQREIEGAYKRLRSKHHPDKGGSAAKFHEVQGAYDQARTELGLS